MGHARTQAASFA